MSRKATPKTTPEIAAPTANVRRLPKGWRTVRFGEVVRDVKEAERNPLAAGLDRFVGLEHIEPENLHLKQWGLLADGETSFTKRFRKGQVLFGKRRAYQRKVAVAEFDGICSSDILTFEPKDDTLIPELLPFIVQSDGFFEHALGTSSGSLSPRTRWSQLQDYEFPLPPKDEQRRIADILWAADKCNTSWRECQIKLELAIERIKDEEFSPNDALLSSPLRELCPNGGIQIGPFGSQLHVSDYTESGVPVVMPVHLTDEKIVANGINRVSESTAERLDKHRLRIGDIVLARRGDLSKRGFVSENEEGWLCGTGCIRVRVAPSIPSRAVFHSLSSRSTVSWINQNAVGTTMPNTNGEIVGRIPVKLPEPSRLPSVLSAVDALFCQLSAVHAHSIETSRLARTLSNQLLTGAT